LPQKVWKSLQNECAGKIDSLSELLQGKLSSAVMQVVTRQNGGLFPSPQEIDLDCSCPDWAGLCKHVAASLYGVGARLDTNPELLFLLRGVDATDLISKASAADAMRQTNNNVPAMSDAEVADVFGIELESSTAIPVLSVRPDSPGPIIAPPVIPSICSVEPSAAKRRKVKRRRKRAVARARLVTMAKARWQRAKEKGLAENGNGSKRGRSTRGVR
jgi:uncharacterized Zn finger protein